MTTVFEEQSPHNLANDGAAADRAQGAPAGEPALWKRYVVAAICVLAAFGIRLFLSRLLGEELPFMLFIAAALVASWYGGAVAGSASLLLGLFLADFVFLSSSKQNVSHSAALIYLVRYVFTASLGIVLIEVLHRSRRNLAREVERRKRSEAALRQAQEQLNQHAAELELRVEERTGELQNAVNSIQNLLYHIAHNFRAPLRAMQGYTTILMNEYAPRLDARAQEYSRHISDSALRMDELIHDLLDYGRLGHMPVQMSSVDAQGVVDRVLYRLAFEIHRKKAEVHVCEPLPGVVGHPELLEQVLTNLIENALKYVAVGQAPKVGIRAEERADHIRISVEDNGIGISPQYHERIFGVFETLAGQARSNGTGIGLAIVRQAMQRMGGASGVESTPGKGSRFWIELPKAATD